MSVTQRIAAKQYKYPEYETGQGPHKILVMD